MRIVASLAAATALLLGQAMPAAAGQGAQEARDGEDRAVCTLALSATFDPGLTLTAANRADYVAKGAIACVGLIGGTDGVVTAGEYRAEGVYTGDCVIGSGTETFTAVFVNGDGSQRTVTGTHQIQNLTPVGVAVGERSGALLHIVPTGGDCHRKSAKSAIVLGELTMPQL